MNISKFIQFNPILLWHYIDIFGWLCGCRIRPPSFLTQVANLRVPKTILNFNNSHNKTQNSLKAIILTIIVYYSKSIQTNISQGKRHVGQEISTCAAPSFPLPVESCIALTPSPCNSVWIDTCSIANQGISPELWGPEFSLRFGHIDIVDSLHGSLTRNYFVNIWCGSKPQFNKDFLTRQDIPRA